MKKETLEEFRLALASRIQIPVLAYMEERLKEVKNLLVTTTKETGIRKLQGRALELQDIINEISKVRE